MKKNEFKKGDLVQTARRIGNNYCGIVLYKEENLSKHSIADVYVVFIPHFGTSFNYFEQDLKPVEAS